MLGIFNEDVGKVVLNRGYMVKIILEMNEMWYKRRGEGVYELFKWFLLDYLGELFIWFIRCVEDFRLMRVLIMLIVNVRLNKYFIC